MKKEHVQCVYFVCVLPPMAQQLTWRSLEFKDAKCRSLLANILTQSMRHVPGRESKRNYKGPGHASITVTRKNEWPLGRHLKSP